MFTVKLHYNIIIVILFYFIFLYITVRIQVGWSHNTQIFILCPGGETICHIRISHVWGYGNSTTQTQVFILGNIPLKKSYYAH